MPPRFTRRNIKNMNLNRILYDYIVERYGSVVDFSDESGISLIDLNAVLLKENVFEEIGIGLNLCEILNIDVEEIVTNGEIKEREREKKGRENKRTVPGSAGGGKTAKNIKNEIYAKCMRLSELEKQMVLDYIASMSTNTNINTPD